VPALVTQVGISLRRASVPSVTSPLGLAAGLVVARWA
jgi:hypothetical protein